MVLEHNMDMVSRGCDLSWQLLHQNFRELGGSLRFSLRTERVLQLMVTQANYRHHKLKSTRNQTNTQQEPSPEPEINKIAAKALIKQIYALN